VIHNERIKLRATYLNTAAGSCLTVGVLTPVAAAFLLTAPSGFGLDLRLSAIGLGVVMWLGASVALHLAADVVLGSLDDE
jgi:hypothetical protein